MTSTLPTLTSEQQAAREYLRQAGAGGIPATYVTLELLALSTQYDQNELAMFEAAATTLLTDLAYGTDFPSISEQLAAGAAQELGYWSGWYCLFDDDGVRYDLTVSRDGALLTIPAAVIDLASVTSPDMIRSLTQLTNAIYADGKLKLSNGSYAFELAFAPPRTEAEMNDPSISAQDFVSATQPRCSGSVTIGAGAQAHTLKLAGKRGSYTPSGVKQVADGDPPATWVGRYLVLDITDVDAIVQTPDPLDITFDDTGLNFVWGDAIGDNLHFSNNALTCTDDMDDRKLYAARFSMTQGGQAQVDFVSVQTGSMSGSSERQLRGYWLDHVPDANFAARSDTMPAPQPKRAALLGGAPVAVAETTDAATLSIDVEDLSESTPLQLQFPDGAAGSEYALTLELSGAAEGDTYTWATVPDPKKTDDPTTRVEVSAVAPGSTAQFKFNSLTDTDVNKKLVVTIQVTRTSGEKPTACLLKATIRVRQETPITINPPTLPPITQGVEQTIKIGAHGGAGLYHWDAAQSTLPPGMTFDSDAGVHTLSGTPSAAGTYTLSLVVSPQSGLIMKPATISYPIVVQQPVSTAVNPWSWWKITSYVVGGVIGLIVIGGIIYGLKKKGKESSKNKEANQIIVDGDSTEGSSVTGDYVTNEDEYSDGGELYVSKAFSDKFNENKRSEVIKNALEKFINNVNLTDEETEALKEEYGNLEEFSEGVAEDALKKVNEEYERSKGVINQMVEKVSMGQHQQLDNESRDRERKESENNSKKLYKSEL